MTTRDRYVMELAEATHLLFASGNIDPSADEIADQHFGKVAIAGDVAITVKKRLKKIRDALEQVYGEHVFLVNDVYYQRFQHNPAKNSTDAGKCIPGLAGGKSCAAGLRRPETDDIYWIASLQQNLSSASGKTRKQAERLIDAINGGLLSDDVRNNLLAQAREQARPTIPLVPVKRRVIRRVAVTKELAP